MLSHVNFANAESNKLTALSSSTIDEASVKEIWRFYLCGTYVASFSWVAMLGIVCVIFLYDISYKNKKE